MADISVRAEETFNSEDRSWTRTKKGYDTCKTVTLDVSTFAAAHIATGALPSGTVLGRITASGKYGPYDADAVNGLETAKGFLFNTTKIGELGSDTDLSAAADVAVPMMVEGEIEEGSLPSFTGTTDGELDAAAEVDLADDFRFSSDY